MLRFTSVRKASSQPDDRFSASRLQRAGSQFVVKNRQVSTSSPTGALRPPFGAGISLEPSPLQTQRFASLKKNKNNPNFVRDEEVRRQRRGEELSSDFGRFRRGWNVCGCVPVCAGACRCVLVCAGVCRDVITYDQILAHLQLRQRREQSWKRLLPPAVDHDRQAEISPLLPEREVNN